jgi:PAS domain S-box-containing protein
VAGVSPRRALDEAYRAFYQMLGNVVTSVIANARANEEEREMARARQEMAERERELRRQAEQRAREAEEARALLKTLLEHVPEGITIVEGPPDFPIKANSAMVEQLLSRPQQTLVGIPAGQHIEAYGLFLADGKTRPTPEQSPLYRASRLGETVKNEEWVVVCPDGSRITALVDAGPIRTPDGQITGAINCWRDITERKRMEEELQRSNEFHEVIADLASDWAFSILVEDACVKNIEAVSKGYNKQLGYTLEELTAQGGLKTIIHPDDLPEAKRQVKPLLAGETVQGELRIVARDGRVILSHYRACPARDELGRVTRIYGALRDITPQRQSEVALRESEERFSKVFKASPHPITITTLDEGHYVDVNEAALRASGYSYEEMIGHTADELQIFAEPEGRVKLIGAFKDGCIRNLEIRLRTKSGEVKQLLMSAEIINLKGQPCILSISNDITERKQIEEALRESEERYRRIVETAYEGIWTIDAEWRTEYVNQRMATMLGCAAPEMAGRSLYDFVFEEDVAKVQHRREQRKQGQSDEFDHRYRRQDGSVLWAHVSASPIHDENGKFIGSLGMFTDITERKWDELNTKFLVELDLELARLTEPEEIEQTAIDRLGEYLNVERCSFLEIEDDHSNVHREWRRKSSSVIGRHAHADYVPPEVSQEFLQGMMVAINDVATDPRTRAFAANFAQVEVGAVACAPVAYKGGWIGALIISARRPRVWREDELQLLRETAAHVWPLIEQARAVQALRESERHFHTLADTMPQLVWTATADGSVDYLNEQWVDFLGYDPRKRPGWDWRRIIHPEELRGALKQRERALRTGSPASGKLRFRRHTGEWRWQLLRGAPLKDQEGRVIKWFGTCTDIDEEIQEERDAQFLANISERTRLARDVDGLMWAVSAAMGEHLSVAQCFFTEIKAEPDRFTIHHDYHPQGPSVAGEYSRSAFGQGVIEELSAGRTVAVHDTASDQRTATCSETYRQLACGAFAAAPLLRGESQVSSLIVGSAEAREWSEREINLLETVAERAWLAAEKLRLDTELRRSNTRFERAESASGGYVYEWDLKTNEVERTAGFGQVMGYGPDEIESRFDWWKSLVHRDDLDRALEEMTVAIERGAGYSSEYRLRHKDGHYVYVWDQGQVMRGPSGQPTRVIGSTVDITRRKQAEEEVVRLLAEEQRHAQKLQELNAASLAINAAASVDELVRLINEKARELIGARMSVVNLIHDGDWSQTKTVASLSDEHATYQEYDAQPTGLGIYNLISRENRTMRLTQAELEERPEWRHFSGETGKHPLRSGALRGWLAAALVIDDSEFCGVVRLSDKYVDGKPAEFTAADEALLAQLAQVASVALENQRVYEQAQVARALAEDANRAKDEFLALVTHELRSPLNAMLGYARMFSVKKKYGEADTRHAFEVIKRSGERQKELIDDLLDTARIITGKLRLEPHPVNLAPIINDALDAMRLAAQAKNIALAAKLDTRAGQITGDAGRLKQVVWNLVNNAIKFTPENGRVEIELKRDGPRVVIAVSDTGKGIAPEFLPHVFERFTQQDASLTRRHGGLGLGLALVKHLVELHGGTIEASSPGEGHGATFIINLPVRAVSGETETRRGGDRETEGRRDRERRRQSKEASVSPSLRLSVSPSSPLSGLWALVVDDEDDARELVSRVLRDHGASVTAVSSAAEAWALITDQPRETRLGALVIDIGLPEEDGYSLMRRVREWERERDSRLSAIALTAYGRAQDRVQALMAGFQMHVPKPVEPEELVAVIKSLVGGKIAP